jgi:hypothetical protein
MATATCVSCIPHVGEVAGTVWRVLSENGRISTSKLVKAVDEPRDTVMLALGWLAREEKITIDEEGRNRMVALR